jgi:hypothetical protein
MVRGLAVSVVVNGVLPVVAYGYLTGHGWTSTSALIGTSIFPIIASLVSLARSRTVDGLSLMSIGFIALGIVGSLLSGSARFLLVKESVLAGLFGVAFAASLALPRPLAYFFGRQFATGGDPYRIEQWDGYWQYPQFRRVQRVITVVWAAALIADAGVRIALVFTLPLATMVWLSPVCLYVVLGATTAWTIAFGRRSQARAQRAGYDV